MSLGDEVAALSALGGTSAAYHRQTFIQAPALDGGSVWWRHTTGQDAPPGVLTMTVGGGGWDDLRVL